MSGFYAKARPKCKHCGNLRGDHKATTMNCPTGRKTRIGWTTWHPTQVYEPVRPASTGNDR